MVTLSEGFAIGLGLAGFVISIITLVYHILRERVIGPIFTAVDPRPKLGQQKELTKSGKLKLVLLFLMMEIEPVYLFIDHILFIA